MQEERKCRKEKKEKRRLEKVKKNRSLNFSFCGSET
jgi:hypothetical protein